MSGSHTNLRKAVRCSVIYSAMIIAVAALWAQPVLASDALVQDATMIAAAKGVTVEEILQRFEIQEVAGKLDAELSVKEAATFAGLWIEDEPEVRIVVQHKGELSDSLHKRLEGAFVEGVVELRQADASLAELETALAASASLVREIAVKADIEIDVKTNQVKVMVLDPEKLDRALWSAGRELPFHVSVVEVGELAREEAFYGGMPLSTCTSGFVVRHPNGTKGLLTAGHCGNTQRYGSTNLPFQSQAYSGSHDVQWHSMSSGYLAPPKIKVGSSTRYIHSTTGRSGQAIGASVCKQGMTTGYTCGTISSKTFLPSYVPSGLATFIRVEGGSTNLSEPGDSGGPWVKGAAAYGIHSCGIGNDSCYMAINYASTLGVSVLLWSAPDPVCEGYCEEMLDYCQEEYCYWNYDAYMCSTGCDLDYMECVEENCHDW